MACLRGALISSIFADDAGTRWQPASSALTATECMTKKTKAATLRMGAVSAQARISGAAAFGRKFFALPYGIRTPDSKIGCKAGERALEYVKGYDAGSRGNI
jgi:hypothetical protein